MIAGVNRATHRQEHISRPRRAFPQPPYIASGRRDVVLCAYLACTPCHRRVSSQIGGKGRSRTCPPGRPQGFAPTSDEKIHRRASEQMQRSTVFDTRRTLIYNIRLRRPRPQGPGRIRDLMPARNYQERSGYFSGSTTKAQSFQGATQSSPQPRRPQTDESRRLSPVPRDEATSPGLSLVRHLSRRPGHRSQREKILDNTVAFGIEFSSGRAGAALLARPLLFLFSRRPASTSEGEHT